MTSLNHTFIVAALIFLALLPCKMVSAHPSILSPPDFQAMKSQVIRIEVVKLSEDRRPLGFATEDEYQQFLDKIGKNRDSGTGFLYIDQGSGAPYIVTCAHVIDRGLGSGGKIIGFFRTNLLNWIFMEETAFMISHF